MSVDTADHFFVDSRRLLIRHSNKLIREETSFDQACQKLKIPKLHFCVLIKSYIFFYKKEAKF